MSAVGLESFSSYGVSSLLGNTESAPGPSRLKKLFDSITLFSDKDLDALQSAPPNGKERMPRLISALAQHTPLIGSRLLGIVQSVFSLFSLVGLTKTPIELEGTGILKGLNLVRSPLGMRSGIKKLLEANERADKVGQFDASLQIARGGTSSVATAMYLPAYAVSLFDALKTYPALLSTAKILGTVSGSMFSFVSGLSFICSSISLHYNRLLYSDLREIVKDPALPEQQRTQKALAYLKMCTNVTEEEKKKICTEVYANTHFATANGAQINAVISRVESLFLANKLAIVSRGLSQKSIRKIQAAEPQNGSAVVDSVYQDSRRRTWLKGISTTLSAISLGLGIAALVLLTPEAIVAMSIVSLAIGVATLGLDIYDMFQQFELAGERSLDRLWIIGSTGLGMAAMLIVTALAKGIVPIIAAAVIGVVWLLMAIVSYVRLRTANLPQ